MSNLVPIQITLQAATAADAKQLVQDLAGTMSGMADVRIPARTEVSTVEEAPVTATVDESKPRRSKISEPKESQAESNAQDVPVTTGKEAEIPSVVELRAKAQEVGKDPAKKPKIKALLNKYGSPNISEVPEEKRAAFMAELEAL